MKKVFYLLASAALLLCACTKDEDPYLRVSAESLTFEGSASSKNVTIESNTAWEITGIKDWVSISKTSGKGDETLSVTVLENDGLDRECTINVSSSAISATIKVSQTGRPNLSVSEAELAFGCEAGEKEVSLKSNKDWTVQSNSDWITVTPSSGKAAESEQTVKIAVAANADSERAGELTFAIGSEASVKVTVTQEGKSSINVSETELAFDSKASEKEVSLKSNKDWTVQSNSDWITVTPSSGKAAESEQTVKIAVAANTDLERAGELTFAIDAETSVKVSVRQEGSVLEYAGVKYRTVKMKDGRTWMAENLRYVPEGKTPSSNPTDGNGIWNPVGDDGNPTTDAAAIAEKGYLYDYPTVLKAEVTKDNFKEFEGAQGICPDGWHIPTRAEFVALCGNSNKADGESGTLIDKNAAFYDEGYNGAKITALDADGFGWSFTGIINKSSATAEGKYSTTKTSSDNCSVEEYLGKPAMSYLLGSTGFAVNKTNGNIQFFGMMSTFSSKFKEGRATVAYTNYLGGQSLRCIKNK